MKPQPQPNATGKRPEWNPYKGGFSGPSRPARESLQKQERRVIRDKIAVEARNLILAAAESQRPPTLEEMSLLGEAVAADMAFDARPIEEMIAECDKPGI